MGLSSSFVPKVAEVFAAPAQRPPVIWLHFGECTGCSEAVLRSTVSLCWTIWFSRSFRLNTMKRLWPRRDNRRKIQLHAAAKKYEGKFICVVEGAIATKFDGGYGKIGGRTFLEIGKEICTKAAGVICIGSCSSFGNIQAAAPNPGRL